MYQKFFKRAIDLGLALLGLVLLSPVFLVITIAIKLDDPGPVFFKQKRVGIHKTSFDLYKFRTMRVNTPDIPTHLLENAEQYISRVGKFLRESSLDELPQLINIASSQMAIIGPRPALWSQQDLLAERDKYGANDLKPGLSGWAQINGRDTVELAEKARYDGEYADKLSFKFDCKCFFGTILKVLKRDGVVEGCVGAAVAKAKEKVGRKDFPNEDISRMPILLPGKLSNK